MNDFVDRIDEQLKLQGKTRTDLYNDLKIPKNLIGNWKQRGTIPSADVACKIASYLKTTSEYLVTGEDTAGYKAKYENLLQDIQNAIEKNK